MGYHPSDLHVKYHPQLITKPGTFISTDGWRVHFFPVCTLSAGVPPPLNVYNPPTGAPWVHTSKHVTTWLPNGGPPLEVTAGRRAAGAHVLSTL